MPKKRLPKECKILIGMAVALTVPFVLTLMTVAQSRPLVSDLQANPTHHGYTWSLSLFIVPVLVLAGWLSSRRQSSIQKRAFWFTTLFISIGGFFLDVFFGLTFFTFPNHDAVLGIYFHGYSFVDGWHKTIPIEEVGFYVFGALAVLLVYVWGDEVWFAAYNVDDAPRRNKRWRDVISFHPASAVFAVLIFLLGLLYKKFGPHSDHEGFPGYFLFLTLVTLTPSIVFFSVASPFINWRAFSLAALFILFVSLFWEATIAVPYQWWGFQPRPMLGLFINGWCGLPVEEPLLWVGITWAAVIIYETISTVLFVGEARRVRKEF
jgi:hypothetical protein